MTKTSKNDYESVLHIDLETYSEVDIKACGAYKYVYDDSFEILLLAYAFDDEEVKVVDLCSGEKIPDKVLKALVNPLFIKVAHNANFERTCLTKHLNTYMKPEEWYCTAVRASELGLPRSLEEVGKAVGLDEDKQKLKVGKSLIEYFCKPCKPTKANNGRTRNMPWHYQERWDLFKEYNKQDVVTEREIMYKLTLYPKTKAAEHELWCLDQRMNDKGVKVNMEMVDNILNYNDHHVEELTNRAKEISHLENPDSLTQIKGWLRTKGLDLSSLTMDVINDLIKSGLKDIKDSDSIIEFLKIRKELGKTSVAKYEAMKRSLTPDGRVHGMLLFYGANRTGRWAGRIVQLHNLPQNKLSNLDEVRNLVINGDFDLLECLYSSPMDIFSQLIRTAFIADTNKTFAVADYSAIEARVIAWLADEEWVNEVFRTHGKIYEATAAQMFHVPIESVTHGSDLRKKGKVAQLACGYQGGVGALSAMDKKGDIPEEEKQGLIDSWRAANPNIVKFWYDTESNFKKAIKNPGVTVDGPKGIKFKMVKDTLFIKLPSGRNIAYNKASIRTKGMRDQIVYMGTNQETKRWELTETYGGKIVENIVQATARDCLGYAMLALAKEGYMPQFHIHDEVVIEVNKDTKEEDLNRIKDIMSLKDLEWKSGLNLKAEGYTTDYYMKD